MDELFIDEFPCLPTVVVVPDPTVRLKASYYSVGEGGGSVEVCAEVTTDQFDSTIEADYVTSPGSATGGTPS